MSLWGRDLIWHSMAGGIFLGVDHSFYDIGSIAEGDFYVKLILRYKTDGFKFALDTV
jgi:hypothetical protein